MIDPEQQKEIEDIIDKRIQTKWQNMSKLQPTPFHQHNGVDSPQLPAKSIKDFDYTIAYNTIVVSTNGTTPVNVFTANGVPYPFTITSVISIAKDATAGNITLKQASNTVATIAKGATAGALVGATSLTNTIYGTTDACTVVSSSAGNSFIIIFFTLT